MLYNIVLVYVQDFVIAPFPHYPNPAQGQLLSQHWANRRFWPCTRYRHERQGLMWYARPQLLLNCMLCPNGSAAVLSSFPWYFSAPLSQSISRHTLWCRATVFHWHTTLPLHLPSQQCFWAVFPSFPTSSVETAAGFFRSALGCGGDSGASRGCSPERYLWLKQKPGDRSGGVRVGSRRRKPWSDARRSARMCFTHTSTAASGWVVKFAVKWYVLYHTI